MIEKLKQLRELLSDLYVEGVIGCSPFNANEFQMEEERFFEMFSNYKTARRPDNEYPFEAFVVIDGLKIYTILTIDEFLKHVIKKGGCLIERRNFASFQRAKPSRMAQRS